ncbi:oxidoreductase subunit [Streptomyces lasiicapitis]|uniref:oxidoreductase subunit n=1 Tax=Streptomyces lasiicapitis TaxID=1923961 RepID=UPI003681EA6D
MKSAAALLALAHRHGVEVPITAVVVDVVEGNRTARDAADVLMARTPKPERYGA